MLATSLVRPATIMAGPFGAADTRRNHLVPADKKLDRGWVESLFERGEKEVFSGAALDNIGMPCGGIGAGQLYLCGDGTLGDWQIFNNARSYWVGDTHSTYTHEGIAKPVEQGFTVVFEKADGSRDFASLSRNGFAQVRFKGEYPIATVSYADQGTPVRVEMEAYSPFIPLNARQSCLPATIFNITVENASSGPLKVSVLGRLENAVANEYTSHSRVVGRTRIARAGSRGMVLHACEEPPKKAAEPVEEPREPIVFETFEGEDYGEWEVFGEAFGEKPASGTLEGQQKVSGFEGEGLVNTFLGGDEPTGRLVSPRFTINRKFINFLIGGGSHQEQTCMNLIIGDKIVHTATGRNNERLSWQVWDVSDYQGKQARIEIIDEASGGWGHINVDQIEFADKAREPEKPPLKEARDYGTMALACADALAPEVLEDRIYPAGAPEAYLVEGDHRYDLEQKRVGALSTTEVDLMPGAKHTFTYVVAWHFPNQENGHYYAQRFDDAAAAANYTLDNHERLSAGTRLWRDTYYDSTLPYWLLDRLHSTLSYLATGTCQWWKNGRFYAYEGVTCCPGTCTHVWNYAHGHARLFPELARSIREMQDFNPRESGGGFHPDTGLVGFRSNDAYAADGQCGTILKAYREHLMSADDAFLKRNWPTIKKALEYSIGRDGNADGLIEDEQHNTYDISYHGANTFVGSLYLGALRAGEEMAREVGDIEFAERVQRIFESGRDLTIERLWNGEYFVQDVDLENYPRHQYKDGCLSDHLFGQGWAHQLGLGYLYPTDKVHSALQAVWKYNWAPDITAYNEEHAPFRWFISPGQAGLFTCTWPHSEYLPEGTVYKN
ncbi:MAG: GH116 family glycosyl hydrolase, partial [Candidatus Hydrogenedentota bacterium]